MIQAILLLAATAPMRGYQPFVATPLANAIATSRTVVTEPTRSDKPAPEDALCSLNVVEWELSKIVRTLSEQSKVNVLLLSPAGAKLTLRLSNIPLSEMIRHLSALSGLRYLKMRGTYVLASEEQLKAGYPVEWALANPETPKPEPIPERTVEWLTEALQVNHVNPLSVAEIVKAMVGDPRLSIVIGPAPVNPSVVTQETAAATGASSVTLTKEDAGPTSKILLFRGPRVSVEQALEAARKLDVRRAQVSILVSIHDVTNEAVKEMGLSWNYSNLSIGEQDPRGLNFGSFSRAPLSFNAVIKALETTDRAKLLASPNISVIDGERAFILIGERLNFPVVIGYTQANTPIFDKQVERVGIYLQVAANVSTDGTITLSLYPQVSTVTGFLQINGGSYPQVSTREAQTTLTVRSGDTIVMGGLLKDEDLSQIEKVPLLSKIPILGELFQRRKRSKRASQVIISITPVVLSEPSP